MSGFFYESAHLEYLVNNALPELIRSYGYGIRKTLTVWIAGCLRGEEPYTLAMVLSEFAHQYPGIGFDFLILASDVSEKLLETAERGIYTEEEAKNVPMPLKKKYLLKSKDRTKKLVKIVPELRELVKFRRMALTTGQVKFRETLDVIFFRGVFDRFDEQPRGDLLHHICQHLSPGGYVFVGETDDLGKMDVPLAPIAKRIYRKFDSGRCSP